ncbi:hypothetical protein PGT21_006610 [Puccinia graminis f. sp. tritici]|uniref:Uncharacterized protein n=1 Tax=Puccinia graminis f. sp. tritici TaxID=56615 RepID=A0A5B0NWS9_PUCGR|nr:hypothetical protein PGT21_006610 [Puccinia graminis f. sp. tritici]
MFKKFVILLAIGLAFTVSASFEGRSGEATVIQVEEHTGNGPPHHPELPSRSGIITGSARPTIILDPEPSFGPSQVSQSSVRPSALTQPLAPPQRVIIHQPPTSQGVPIGLRPFNHQHGAGHLAVHPQPPPATQAGVGVPVNYHPGAGLPAGHPQTSPPAPAGARPVNYHQLSAGSSAGQPRLMTQVPPAVRTWHAPSRQTGPASYQQQGAGHCAVHSQALSGTSVGQASPVPNYPQPVAGRPDVPLQGNPMTSSHVVPPAPTTNEARPVEYIQIDDTPSEPLQPSQPAHEPDPSTQPSSSAPPARKPVYRQQRSSRPAVPVSHFPHSENVRNPPNGGSTQQVQPGNLGNSATFPTQDSNHPTQNPSNTPMGFLLTDDGQTWKVPLPPSFLARKGLTGQPSGIQDTSSAGSQAQPIQNTDQINLSSSIRQAGHLTSSDIKDIYQKISKNFNPQTKTYSQTPSTSNTLHQGPLTQNNNHLNQYQGPTQTVQTRNPPVQTRPIIQHQLAAYSNPPQGGITNLAPGTRTLINSNPTPTTPNQNTFLQCPVHGQQNHPTLHNPAGPPSHPQGTSSNPIVLNERQTNQNANQSNQIPAGPQNSGTILNDGQRNSQDSFSGQPQRGINNMAQGSTTGHIHNPGPHVLDTQFDQSQSDCTRLYLGLLKVIRDGPVHQINPQSSLTEAQQYPASFGDAVEKWFFERHDSCYRNGIGNPPGNGVLPNFQLKIDIAKKQIRESIRSLSAISPALYQGLQNEYRNVIQRLYSSFSQQSTKTHPGNQPHQSPTINISQSLAQPQSSVQKSSFIQQTLPGHPGPSSSSPGLKATSPHPSNPQYQKSTQNLAETNTPQAQDLQTLNSAQMMQIQMDMQKRQNEALMRMQRNLSQNPHSLMHHNSCPPIFQRAPTSAFDSNQAPISQNINPSTSLQHATQENRQGILQNFHSPPQGNPNTQAHNQGSTNNPSTINQENTSQSINQPTPNPSNSQNMGNQGLIFDPMGISSREKRKIVEIPDDDNDPNDPHKKKKSS